MSDKEQIVANLFASSSGADTRGGDAKNKVLIEEVGAPRVESGSSSDQQPNASSSSSSSSSSSASSTPPSEEGPSLMEQMMEAQQVAQRRDEAARAQQQALEDKKALGGGFKKGFFGGGGGSTAKQKAAAASTKKEDKKDHIPTIKAKKSASIAGQGQKGVVLDDVQRALREQQQEQTSPLLKQLQGGDWANDDLMAQLQRHPVLARGLQNPQCQAALQLMQTDPAEAKKRFEHDPEVAGFMQAFSALMAEHFTRLGEQQQQEQQQQEQEQEEQKKKPPPPPPVPQGQVEVGPLHAAAMKRQQAQKQGGGVISEVNQEEEARVKDIVQDEELRNMLMDPALQRVLQECNDPREFQKHMRDPVTAYKIKKLFAAGLVGTAK